MAVWIVWTCSGINASWILSRNISRQWNSSWVMSTCTSVTVWVVRAGCWIYSGWIPKTMQEPIYINIYLRCGHFLYFLYIRPPPKYSPKPIWSSTIFISLFVSKPWNQQISIKPRILSCQNSKLAAIRFILDASQKKKKNNHSLVTTWSLDIVRIVEIIVRQWPIPVIVCVCCWSWSSMVIPVPCTMIIPVVWCGWSYWSCTMQQCIVTDWETFSCIFTIWMGEKMIIYIIMAPKTTFVQFQNYKPGHNAGSTPAG